MRRDIRLDLEPYDMQCDGCGFSWEEEGPVRLPSGIRPLSVTSCHWCDPARNGVPPRVEEGHP